MLWGAVVLSSSFDNFLKSFQANCRPEIGSNTLRLDVFVPGLNGSSLVENCPWTFLLLLVLWSCRRGRTAGGTSGRGSQPVAVSSLDLFSFLWHSSWAHLMSSVASYLVEFHTFMCCDLLLSRGVACLLNDGDWSVLCCSCCGCGEVESSSLTSTSL